MSNISDTHCWMLCISESSTNRARQIYDWMICILNIHWSLNIYRQIKYLISIFARLFEFDKVTASESKRDPIRRTIISFLCPKVNQHWSMEIVQLIIGVCTRSTRLGQITRTWKQDKFSKKKKIENRSWRLLVTSCFVPRKKKIHLHLSSMNT